MSKKTICLNMIVKNEAHVIQETFNNVLKYIDYWVICDTGSTDGTQSIIKQFFQNHNVPGLLLQHEWKNFGHNRTLALEACKSLQYHIDYIFVIDADDLIVGDLQFPQNMTSDSYKLIYGHDFTYTRLQIYGNHLDWRYVGVLHEYSECTNKNIATTSTLIEGNYYIDSRRLGARNKNPNKYLNDAEILVKAIEDIKNNNDDTFLIARYAFYAGQSYTDFGDIENGIKYYKMRTELGGWFEEVYYSYYKIALNLKKKYINDNNQSNIALIEQAFLQAYYYCNSRAEPLYELALMFRLKNNFEKGYNYACMGLKIPYPKDQELFISKDVYEWKMKDECGISAYYVKKYQESYDFCQDLLNSTTLPNHERQRVEMNLDFCIPYIKDINKSQPIKEPINKDLKSLYKTLINYKNKNDWANALSTYHIIKAKYDQNNDIDNILKFKIDYEYIIFSYYAGNRNINDSIIHVLNNCDEFNPYISCLLSNMKFYQFILKPTKVIELKLSMTHNINNIDYLFNSSSSSIIPNFTNDGYLMNVRLVNYFIDPNGNYINWGNKHIITINKFIELNKYFDIINQRLLKIKYVDKLFIGIEDIRIFPNNDNSLSFIGTGFHLDNKIGIVYGDYDKDISDPIEIEPEFNKNSDCEKNWVFINYKGYRHVIYNWYPIRICTINKFTNLLEIIETISGNTLPLFFKHIRGSTCAFEYNHEFWFIVHMVSYEKPRHYYHFILVFDDNMNLSRYSPAFKFEGEPIEYCIGLIVEDSRVITTYSSWDRCTKIAIYDKSYIDNILTYKH